MRGRHALLVGFGLGGLVVLVAVVLASGTMTLGPFTPSGNAHLASISPDSTPIPSTSPTVTAAGPGPRAGSVFVYEPDDHAVLLFGGSKAVPTADGGQHAVSMDDTWLWNGKSWKQLAVQGPPARSAAVATYDSARHVVVVFGGSGPTGAGPALLLDDTWVWNGDRWQQLQPMHSPNPRFDAAMAFDEARGVAVLYGGYGQTESYTATWTWDGVDWTLQDPKTVPPVRHFASMAYDSARGVTVLFGGSTAGARLNDTWLWDGTNWSQATSASTASGWSQLVYDSKRKQVVAYVYFALDNHPVTEFTVTWDGAQWTDRSTKGDPSPRAVVSLAFDPDTNQVVLYGPGDELWTWDGTTWSLWQTG